MSTIELFTYADTHNLRVVRDLDGDALMVLADLCRALDIRNARDVAARLADDQKGVALIDTPGGAQQMTVVNESGLYEVIIRSDKPEAAKFRRWITTEVLPAIRRTGTYSRYPAQPRELPSKRQLAQMVIDAEDRADAESRARVEAESRAKELAIPASAWSHMADSTGDYAVDDAAKVLSRDPAINIGRGRLFSFMAAEGWIFRDKSTSRWKAYQTQVDTGRLIEKLGSPYLHEPTGEMKLPAPTIRITAKGLAELHKRLGGAEQLPLLA
ncbi:gp54 protein [Mycobacteroides abscessus subsp. massiliense]|uniref:phage antirepressor n=1 Tax=Mycobacteroides abscessus TaxID=36809 RepID=UPI0009A8A81B|nr:phage antirepressor KilAC domain-containing protein [Mycobacteroides abscessus]SKQ04208.1 gp54 protein [Mycobacteroides abscessus subsp. massiliense]